MTAAQTISIHDQGAFDLVKTLLRQGVSVRIQVSGRSMSPFLTGGETIKLSPVAGSTLRLGDLLLHASSQNNPLVHRLVRRRYFNKILHLQTKGDNCAYLDQFVPIDQILARVQSVETTDCRTNERVTIDFDTAAIRLKGLLIVGQGLTMYYLRRIRAEILCR